ncbi:MAG: hypothetical protein LBL65_06165 [Campylobacteraceae bacterium]|jgi:hypothetical protein|nr:hypothetical protein [Campylobacteraceae bacterium]
MASTRNVDIGNGGYELLRRSNKELVESRTASIRDAVEQTVKSVLGGEFLTNVKIYQIPHITKSIEQETQLYYAAEGDVWGFKSNNIRTLRFCAWRRSYMDRIQCIR